MFQNERSSKGKNDVPLGKKARKELVKAVRTLFISQDCAEMLDKIFMEGTVTVRKVKSGTIKLYYKQPSEWWPFLRTTQCIWMTVDTVHAPTVALLSVLQGFPNTVSVPSNVSKYICRGANLMRAGMISITTTNDTNDFDNHNDNGRIVAVCVHGNPQPFCVGQLTSNINNESIGPGTTGVGVQIWNTYGDDLWKSTNYPPPKVNVNGDGILNNLGGAIFDNGHYGNIGFTDGTMVRPIVTITNSKSENENKSKTHDEEGVVDQNTSYLEMNAETTIINDSSTNNLLPTVSNDDQTPKPTDEPQSEGSSSVKAVQLDDSPSSPVNNNDNVENPHDSLLHYSVCQAIVNIKDKDLPMPTSIFYANHVLSSRPPDTTIEMKKTSWKKFSTYLLQMQRDGLLTLAPDKHKNIASFIKSVQRNHEELLGLKKLKVMDVTKKPTMEIVPLYVIPHHFVDLMRLNVDTVKGVNAKSEERRGTGLLTLAEARTILETYLMENELILTHNKSEAALDAPLIVALFKKEANANPPSTMSRKDLNDLWISKMEDAHALVEMPGSRFVTLKRGMPPKILVEVKNGQSKRCVTRVRGLEEYGIHPPEFCHNVTKRFGCAGTIKADMSGRAALKKNHVELAFQGHLVEELCALLLGDESLTIHGGAKGSDYCLPKRSIEVILKKGARAKKSH